MNKKIIKVCFLFFFLIHNLLFLQTQSGVQAAGSLWQSLAPGIEYREYYYQRRNKIYVTRMDRHNPNVTLETSIGQGKISGGAERVSDMFRRYDQTINYWNGIWGNRNQVVVGINGYFFDKDTGIPWQGQIQSGWYVKRFSDLESGSGLAWKFDGEIFIGGCTVHRPAKQFITFLRTGKQLRIDGINIPRTENSIVLYTPQFDTNTLTDDDGVEILVEVNSPVMVVSAPEMVHGTIESVFVNKGSTLIPFDYVVISASGNKARELQELAATGDEIGITQEVKNFMPDCKTKSNFSWEHTYAGIGGSFHFLKDGEIIGSNDLGSLYRNARTAVVYNQDYVYFIVLAEKGEILNPGLSIVELAAFAKMVLGATDGVALDGGGSSTMVVNGEIKNMRPDQERPVANGLMMVVVQKRMQSQKFIPNESVFAVGSESVDIYLGPGTNYGVVGTIPVNTRGIILKNKNNLDGVFAKNAYWWRVSFDGVVGWVDEDNLQIAP